MQTKEKNNYEFHSDAGHGWLRVPFIELIELGIQPTEFSYRDADYAYLEEDCDAALFLKAIDPEWFAGDKKESIWKVWNIPEIYDGESSFIRALASVGKVGKKPTNPKSQYRGLFPEIFEKWGIETESAAERKAKGSLNERHTKAVRLIKHLQGWRTDAWYLMPVLWLEAKATELCEKADAERAARAERERIEAEKNAVKAAA